jgi:hypothetical protein
MNATLKSLGIDRLGIDERLALVEEIWDSIAADSGALPLTGIPDDSAGRLTEM